MKIPQTFDFSSDKWKVKLEITPQMKEGSCRGLTIFDERIIYIDPNMGIDQKEETFIHEMLHVCGHYSSITGTKLGDESFITAIAPILRLILKQNPQLLNSETHD